MRAEPLCVDASFVVRLLVPGPEQERVEDLWRAWSAERRRVFAPALMPVEVANALYRYERAGALTAAEVDEALALVQALAFVIVDEPGLHAEAVKLARRYALPAVYDAHYLAVSARLGADLWTADRKLAAAAPLPTLHVV